MRRHRPTALALAAALALGLSGGLAACGDDDDSADDTAPAGEDVATTATGGEAEGGATTAAGGEAEGSGDRIVIADFAFDPADLEVAAGTEVTWENVDGVPHQIAASDESFGSEALNAGDTFSFTFADGGEFAYICAIHPSMTGTVTVA